MTRQQRRAAARDVIWETMVSRAEALHDLVAQCQARPTRGAAKRLEALAHDIVALIQADSAIEREHGS